MVLWKCEPVHMQPPPIYPIFQIPSPLQIKIIIFAALFISRGNLTHCKTTQDSLKTTNTFVLYSILKHHTDIQKHSLLYLLSNSIFLLYLLTTRCTNNIPHAARAANFLPKPQLIFDLINTCQSWLSHYYLIINV